MSVNQIMAVIYIDKRYLNMYRVPRKEWGGVFPAIFGEKMLEMRKV